MQRPAATCAAARSLCSLSHPVYHVCFLRLEDFMLAASVSVALCSSSAKTFLFSCSYSHFDLRFILQSPKPLCSEN
jgi:hypothetical protein